MSTTRPDKEWWTAAEIADARLPGLPDALRSVFNLIKREGWDVDVVNCRQRTGKGGGKEYSWQLFPFRARKHLLAKASLSVLDTKSPELTELRIYYDSLPEKAKNKAQNRLRVLRLVKGMEEDGATRFVAVAAAASEHNVSERTVWNWLDLVKGHLEHDWLFLLAPRNKMAKRSIEKASCSPEFWDWLKSRYLQLEGPTFAQCYRDAVRVAQVRNWDVLTQRTASRRLHETVTRVEMVAAREGDIGLHQCFPPMKRDRSDLFGVAAVNADCHKIDIFVEWEDGTVERVQLIVFQDTYSRKIMSWKVDHTPNEVAVMEAFGEMCETFGIPTHCTFDNGMEFASKWLTGGCKTRYRGKVREDDIKGVFPLLGIEIHFARPASGQSKPIERAFRDFASDLAKDIRFQGAYVGNRPDAKPENYKSRAIPIDLFLRVTAERVAEHNARLGRVDDVSNGRSFDEVFAQSYAQTPIRKVSEQHKRLWLMGQMKRTLRRGSGMLKLYQGEYWSDWLAEYPGKQVVARFDLNNLPAGVYIYELTGEFLGFAPCLKPGPFYSVKAAKEHNRARAQFVRHAKGMAKAQKKLSPKQMGADLDVSAIPVAEDVSSKIVSMRRDDTRPQASVIQRPVANAEITPEQEAQVLELEKFEERRQEKIRKEAEETREALYLRMLEVERRLHSGEEVGEGELRWVTGYKTTAEYRAIHAMVERHGTEFLEAYT